MLAIVFDAADYYGSAGALLDQGFNTPVAAEMTLDHLPPVVADASLPSPAARRGEGAGGVPVAPAAATVGPQSRADSSLFNSPLVAMVVLVLGLAGLVVLRRRTVVRRRRARALARRRAAQEQLDLDGVPDEMGVGFDFEEELGRVMLVDVTDEPVVEAVADELA
jgi:hypothetical protein